MLDQLRGNWWILALRGLAGVAFGVAALLWPAVSERAIVVLYGTYAIVDGALAASTALRKRRAHGRRATLWLEGLVGALAGIVAWVFPGMTTLTLAFVVASWAVITGIFELAAALRLREELEGEWLLSGAALASLAFGIALATRPSSGPLALLWVFGGYAIAFGLLVAALAVVLRVAHRASAPRGVHV